MRHRKMLVAKECGMVRRGRSKGATSKEAEAQSRALSLREL